MVEQQEQHRATSNSCWLKIENFQFYIKLVLILCYTKNDINNFWRQFTSVLVLSRISRANPGKLYNLYGYVSLLKNG